MRRVKLLIEYVGRDYVGWQSQENGKSIQEQIELALFQIYKKNIRLFVSGRTDAGVHALGQVAHFDLDDDRLEEKKICYAINYFLKKNNDTIVIIDSEFVETTFHARFSVKKKIYLYKIFNRKIPSFFLEDRAWFIPVNLNLEKISKATKHLIGKHDFNSFRSSDCQAKSSVRTIENISISKFENMIKIRVFGKSFMHNQVRIIVGTLVNVGKGVFDVEIIPDIIKQKDRKKAGPTAPPSGLYLEKIEY